MSDTVAAKFPMYVVRGLGGAMYLSGVLIMAWNLYMTVRAQPAPAAVNTNDLVPAE